MRLKKLLLVYDVSYPHVKGGGQRRMFEVARRLKARGYEVHWLCFRTWEGDQVLESEWGIRYIGLPGYRGLYRDDGARRGAEPFEFLREFLRSGFRISDYDIVWSGQWPVLHLVWWMLFPRVLGRAKLIVDWWEIWGTTWFNYSRKLGLVGYCLEKFLLYRLPKAGTLVLISPGSYRLASRQIRHGRLKLIHNGIDLTAIMAAKSNLGYQSDIVYLGRLKDHKRVDLLLQAMVYLKKESGLHLQLCIVGDGPEKEFLMSMAKNLDISGQVRFTGTISSNTAVYEILRASKIFVNPSIKEGGGSITLFEAFACGLPVVAFDCKDGIDPELVGDGISGKLVKQISAEALAVAIREVMVNPEMLKSLRTGALESSMKYDWGAITQDYDEIFQAHRTAV